MNGLEIKFTPEFHQRAKGPELRATWAQIEIAVNGAPVTRVNDLRAKTVRNMVYGPLYPLAEWLATHWFFIFDEVYVGGKSQYEKRHSIRFAGEGYALPDLEFRPEGENIRLRWSRYSAPHQSVEFLTDGEALIPVGEVRDVLWKFLDETCLRLCELAPGLDTLLQKEWEAIGNLGEEETDFCRTVARLGLDPFSTSHEEQDAILGAARRIPSTLIGDLCSVVPLAELSVSCDWLCATIENPSPILIRDGTLLSVRARVPSASVPGLPWEKGYFRAREVRRLIGLNGGSPLEQDPLLGLSPSSVNVPLPNVDAFITVADGYPGIALAPRRRSAERFALARSLYEYFYPASGPHALVSRAVTERQKENRAFAAEILAPAESLRKQIGTASSITQDDIEELAQEFDVSSMVIGKQIENHQLAQIVA